MLQGHNYLLYPQSKHELATELIALCNDYHERFLSGRDLQNYILHYATVSKKHFFDGPDLNKTILTKIGKKRTDLILQLLYGHQLTL